MASDKPTHTTATVTAGPWDVPWDRAVDISDLIALQRSDRHRARLLRILSLVLLTVGLTVVAHPLLLQCQSSIRLAQETSSTAARVAGWPYPQADESLTAARAYNTRLARSGQPILGETGDPFNDGSRTSASDRDDEYRSLLDAGDGVMGAIRIPKISVDLPIRHGTAEQALTSGAGHLYGSSLPVGGASTHAVITGHRGLVDALMFTRLDEMRVGDFFYIDVMGETLGYKVDRITVISPDDAGLLTITPGEDRVTLMTCTPYGVNTHRLLVSALRAAIPGDIPSPGQAGGDPRMAALTASAVTLVPLLIPAAMCNRSRPRMRHGTFQRKQS